MAIAAPQRSGLQTAPGPSRTAPPEPKKRPRERPHTRGTGAENPPPRQSPPGRQRPLQRRGADRFTDPANLSQTEKSYDRSRVGDHRAGPQSSPQGLDRRAETQKSEPPRRRGRARPQGVAAQSLD